VVLALASEFDAGAPQRRLPDPCGALEPECERPRVAIEEATDPIELRFATDDILEREASVSDCRQRLPPFPERTPDGSFRQPHGRRASGTPAKTMGISPFQSSLRRRSLERVTTYLIEAYVAGGEITDLQERARTAAETMRSEGDAVRYLRSVLVPADETWFHLFEAASKDIVAELAQRAGLRYERIVEAEEHLSGRAERKQTRALDRLKGGPQ
jgi:hypothetical protein